MDTYSDFMTASKVESHRFFPPSFLFSMPVNLNELYFGAHGCGESNRSNNV